MSEKEHTTPEAGDNATTETDAPTAKMSAEEKANADASIKSKQSIDDLKARAAAAKKRAQEKILDKAFVSDPVDDPLERLANTFDNSAKRWEMVVYPSLFAFVLLAGYGFFLIYRLTHDIALLSQSVTHMAVIVSDVMPRMSKDITTMSDDIGGMTGEISSMSNQMNSLTPISKNIQSMTHNLGSMNHSVYGMQRDIGGMNRTVSSGPFGMMNDMMPFSSNSNVPRAIPPSTIWPSYNAAPQQAPRTAQPPPMRRSKSATGSALNLKQPVKSLTSEPVLKNMTQKKSSEKATVVEKMMLDVSTVSLKNQHRAKL